MGTVHPHGPEPARSWLTQRADGDPSSDDAFWSPRDGGLQRLALRGWGPLR